MAAPTFTSFADIATLIGADQIMGFSVNICQPPFLALHHDHKLLIFVDKSGLIYNVIAKYNSQTNEIAHNDVNVIAPNTIAPNTNVMAHTDAVTGLLLEAKPGGPRETLVYYGKQYTIPQPGDIMWVQYTNFATYPILITKVHKSGTGKDNPTYRGIILNQVGITGYAPNSITSRAQLTLSDRRVKIVPKDRSKIQNTTIADY